MFFPSIPFLFYFLPIALILYWIVPAALKNPVLLLISLTFYAWGEPFFLLPMFFIIIVNYIQGRKLEGADNPLYKKRVITTTVILNVAALMLVLCFHRLAFMITSWLNLPPLSFHVPIPLGISFFTLQAMTYVFEIARGKVEPEKSFVNVGLFIAFFPTVLFGPIICYTDLADQIRQRRTTIELFGSGWERFVVGLAKLVILAVPLNDVAMSIFNNSALRDQVGGTPVAFAWFGLLAFSLQFYLAFSGYSDMAIGLARLFGFSLKENFNYPYTAHSVVHFWNRWNISLYRWFYVYVFIAMGGRRPKKVVVGRIMKPKNFALRNYLVMWVLFGLWHGISWNTMAFGLWFFIFVLFEWIISLEQKEKSTWLRSLYVLPVVAIGWVFLGCRSISDSFTYISNLLGINNNGFYGDMVGVYIKEYWHIIILGIIACTPVMAKFLGWIEQRRNGLARHFFAICHILIMLGLLYLCLVYANEIPAVPLIRFHQPLM